jgi:hypothetical protein
VTFGDLKDEGWEGKEWIYVAQDSNRCEHGNEPSVSKKPQEFLYQLRVIVSFTVLLEASQLLTCFDGLSVAVPQQSDKRYKSQKSYNSFHRIGHCTLEV